MDLSQFLLFLVYPIIKPEQKTLSPTWKIQRLYWRVFQILWKCKTLAYTDYNDRTDIPPFHWIFSFKLSGTINIVSSEKGLQIAIAISKYNIKSRWRFLKNAVRPTSFTSISFGSIFRYFLVQLLLPLCFAPQKTTILRFSHISR